MPGGNKNIRPEDGKQFTSDNQPANRGRKKGSRAWKDVLSDMMPEEGYLSFQDIQVLDPETEKPTGEIIPKGRVKMATQEMIVVAAVKQAMKGKTDAIRMIWERMDGRPTQPLSSDPDNPLNPVILINDITGNKAKQ